MEKCDTQLEQQLKINEIFYSLQGEAATSGVPTVFVRLSGCPLRCTYCDTAYAFYQGERMDLARIIERVTAYGARYVCVTGGEPLAQPNCHLLMTALCDQGFNVSLETSGALPIHAVDPRVKRVVDVKTPDSGEVDKNLEDNMQHLNEQDQLKCVIGSRRDYEWACAWLKRHPNVPAEMFFSPSYEKIESKILAEWILSDRLPVRMQLQMHKIIWGDLPGV
jgi:7-carboxy-7-deazaguanine synthase